MVGSGLRASWVETTIDTSRGKKFMHVFILSQGGFEEMLDNNVMQMVETQCLAAEHIWLNQKPDYKFT